MPTLRLLLAVCVLLGVSAATTAAEPQADEYYRIVDVPIPADIFLEVGALRQMPDGRIAASSRRGDIYLIDGAQATPIGQPVFTKFAEGLHEVLGLAVRDGCLYATQRCEVTRLEDLDGDDRADLFSTVSDAWGISGDYHEYAFGSEFDREGCLWVVLCLTGSYSADDRAPFRGWCVRVTADGQMIPTASGLRSPGGIGMNAAGDVFYTDNQGPWNGTCSLKWLRPGSFQGHPDSFKFYRLAEEMGPAPEVPESDTRIMQQARHIPQLEPPAVLFPYQKMGQSASGIVCDQTGGAFGPFTEQLFVGDQTHSTVMRVFLEKVEGHYQGACFPFLSGFDSGSLALLLTPNGQLFVGGTNRGWASVGPKPYSLERVDWTGKVPFEVHQMHAERDGFTLTFTQPVDVATASDPKSYEVQTYTYIYRAEYGSPEVDHTRPVISRIDVAADRRSVRLHLDRVEIGHVHEVHLDGVRNAEGQPLWHPVAYYTLNYLPERD